jgi:hypothetical protein
MRFKWTATTRKVCVIVLILPSISAVAGGVSGQTQSQATIIPPTSCQVYTGETYPLMIGVQYSFAAAGVYVTSAPSSYSLWIESGTYVSDQVTVSGSGTTQLTLTFTAPSTPGVFTLPLTLYAQTGGEQPMVMNTASVDCEAVQPLTTDWSVTKVWLDPAAPGEGDKVTFHATIALVSTNSPQPLTPQVVCLLDGATYYTGSLTFAPQPSSQDLTVPQTWTATKGTHTLTCIVDPDDEYGDVNPYPQGDFNEITFAVQAYYAVIQSITPSPFAVNEGDQFNVVIRVAYHFPESATLKVSHQNNQTQPSSEDRVDNAPLSGSGTKDYTFTVRAPFRNSTYGGNRTCVQKYMLTGQGFVWFDRGEGAGWEKTDPGWTSYYNVTIKRPQYYARFTQVTAQYMGSANATGHVTITLGVRYVLPVQTGLWITIEKFDNSSQARLMTLGSTVVAWDQSSFTQQNSAERRTTFAYTYSYPISSLTSGTLTFKAAVEYNACGGWNPGDQGTVSTPVPYTPYKQPTSASDYLIAAIQRILEWFRSIFGAPPQPTT